MATHAAARHVNHQTAASAVLHRTQYATAAATTAVQCQLDKATSQVRCRGKLACYLCSSPVPWDTLSLKPTSTPGAAGQTLQSEAPPMLPAGPGGRGASPQCASLLPVPA